MLLFNPRQSLALGLVIVALTQVGRDTGWGDLPRGGRGRRALAVLGFTRLWVGLTTSPPAPMPAGVSSSHR